MCVPTLEKPVATEVKSVKNYFKSMNLPAVVYGMLPYGKNTE